MVLNMYVDTKNEREYHNIYFKLVDELFKNSSSPEIMAYIMETSQKILAAGYIVSVINNENPKGQLRVQRVDTPLEYDLGYFIGNETFVVTQPNSQRAWLWVKRIDY